MSRRGAVLACGCGLLVLAGCATPAERAQMNAQSLSSDAAEGVRLADQISQHRVSSVFARAHAQELQDDVSQVQENVSDETSPGKGDLLKLADQLSSALGTMVVHPGDPSVARQAKATLTGLSSPLSGLAS